MYFNKFQFRLEEIIEKNGGRPIEKNGGRPTHSLIFLRRAGEIAGHLAFSWPKQKQKKNFNPENLAKRRR